ncbi:MAG: DUF6318 family protein [Kineosporiaceae bacterium]
MRVVAALLSAVAVVALSACSGGGERPLGSVTVASPTAAASASGPSTDVLLPPTLPPAASEHTVAGAEATFRHFLDLYAYAFAAADPDPLRNVCSGESEFCRQLIADVEEIRGADSKVLNGGFERVMVKGTDMGNPDQIVIRAVVDQNSSVLVSKVTSRTLRTRGAARDVGMNARMDWDGYRWHIGQANVDPVPSKS